MSLDGIRDLPSLAARRFVLATDLDGTFLGGSMDDRQTLYRWIEENRQTIGLIFVTGRDPGFITELCKGGVPWPEYVIGDVGTTIARVAPGGRIEPIRALEEDIAAIWNDAGARGAARGAGPDLATDRVPLSRELRSGS